MLFLILIPILLLPIFLICFYIYRKVFEGNYLILGLTIMIILLGVAVYFFYRFNLDEKLTMRTSRYALRFNEIRLKNNLPLLTYNFTQDGKTWNTKMDSVSDISKFVLLQKTLEENDAHDDAELEYNFLAKALSDTTVLYLKTQYNFITNNFYAETTVGNLKRPSYMINKLRVFDDCCSKPYKRSQVDSLMNAK